HAARLRFCPDLPAVQNLARENQTAGVHFTGDVMYDAFVHFSRLAAQQVPLARKLGLEEKRFALLTVPRPNHTDPMEAVQRLTTLLERSSLPIVFPVHPRTEAALKARGLWERCRRASQAQLIPAIGYLDMLSLLNSAEIVLTDSGGMQKEAYFA